VGWLAPCGDADGARGPAMGTTAQEATVLASLGSCARRDEERDQTERSQTEGEKMSSGGKLCSAGRSAQLGCGHSSGVLTREENGKSGGALGLVSAEKNMTLSGGSAAQRHDAPAARQQQAWT
jgi:hypothetical protein